MTHSARTSRSAAARTVAASGAALLALTLLHSGAGAPVHPPGTVLEGSAHGGPHVSAGTDCDLPCAVARP